MNRIGGKGLEEVPQRYRLGEDKPRQAKLRVRQSAPLPIHDRAGKVVRFLNYGGEGRPVLNRCCFVDDRDQSIPHDLDSYRIELQLRSHRAYNWDLTGSLMRDSGNGLYLDPDVVSP